jgi:hypothetical protein
MTTTDRPASDVQDIVERINGIHRLARACQHGNEPRSHWAAAFELIADHAAILAAEVERLREEMCGMVKLNYRGRLPMRRIHDDDTTRED